MNVYEFKEPHAEKKNILAALLIFCLNIREKKV